MISLWIVILSLAIIFVGLYFIFKMNKDESLPKPPHNRRHPKT
ncbi:hypothetical protein [Bdellovibrio sp.]